MPPWWYQQIFRNKSTKWAPSLAYMICFNKIQQHSHLQLLFWKVAGENICFALDVHTWVYRRDASWVYGAQCRVPKAAPRIPPPPPTALSTWSALPYLVCFCILCCSYFSWGIFLVALQLQDMHLGHVVLVKDMYMGQGSPQFKVQLADSYDGQLMRYSSLSSQALLKWSRKEQILPVHYYHLSNTITR